jgi:hypothetical protein
MSALRRLRIAGRRQVTLGFIAALLLVAPTAGTAGQLPSEPDAAPQPRPMSPVPSAADVLSL